MLHNNKELFEQAVLKTAEYMNIDAGIVEKDYFVTLMLKEISSTVPDLVFKGILEQVGRKMTLKTSSRTMPVIGGVFGAFFDTAQMQKIINYADIFYNKRFLEEKAARINALVNPEESIENVIIDILE